MKSKTVSTTQTKFQGFSPLNYTQTPDQFFDEVAPFLSEAQLKVMLYVIRRTFGFKKNADNISLSQMLNGIVTKEGKRLDNGVGVRKKALLKALNWLEENVYIVRTRNKSLKQGDEATTFSLNIANVTPGVQKTPPPRSPENTRGRSLKDATQDTVEQETVINSNRKNSKFKNVDKLGSKEERGGGIKKLSDLLPPILKQAKFEATSGQNEMIPPRDEIVSSSKKPLRKKPLQALREQSRLDVVMVKISQDIGDQKHQMENIKQAKNIFAYLKKQGVSEDQFIDTLFNVKGLTAELSNLDRPGAYFFKVLRDKWKVNTTSPP